MKKIIFCGTPKIAVDVLKALETLDVKILAVVCQPDKQIGRKKEIIYSPIKQYCLKKNYKLFQPEKIKTILESLKELNPDFLVTCAYGQFIPNSVLNIFKNCVNVHASLLPKYRGGSPVQYAIMNGEQETGISLMKMIKEMDKGEVYSQKSIKIEINDDNEIVFNKLSKLAQDMIKSDLLKIFNNQLQGIEQDESKVTFAYNLKNEQEQINWNNSALRIHNFVRALSPKPIAFTFINNERIKIKKTRLIAKNEHIQVNCKIFENGEIAQIDDEGIIVSTIEGFLKILLLQREGKKMTEAWTFKNKNSFIKIGDIFYSKN